MVKILKLAGKVVEQISSFQHVAINVVSLPYKFQDHIFNPVRVTAEKDSHTKLSKFRSDGDFVILYS